MSTHRPRPRTATMSKKGAARLFAVLFTFVAIISGAMVITAVDDVTRAGSALACTVAVVCASNQNAKAKGSRKRGKR